MLFLVPFCLLAIAQVFFFFLLCMRMRTLAQKFRGQPQTITAGRAWSLESDYADPDSMRNKLEKTATATATATASTELGVDDLFPS